MMAQAHVCARCACIGKDATLIDGELAAYLAGTLLLNSAAEYVGGVSQGDLIDLAEEHPGLRLILGGEDDDGVRVIDGLVGEVSLEAYYGEVGRVLQSAEDRGFESRGNGTVWVYGWFD